MSRFYGSLSTIGYDHTGPVVDYDPMSSSMYNRNMTDSTALLLVRFF